MAFGVTSSWHPWLIHRLAKLLFLRVNLTTFVRMCRCGYACYIPCSQNSARLLGSVLEPLDGSTHKPHRPSRADCL